MLFSLAHAEIINLKCERKRHMRILFFFFFFILFFQFTSFLTVFQSNATLTSPLIIETSYGENNDTYIIKLKNPSEVKNNSLQVNLKFDSRLSDTLQGFYRVNYEDSGSDTERWLISISLKDTNMNGFTITICFRFTNTRMTHMRNNEPFRMIIIYDY